LYLGMLPIGIQRRGFRVIRAVWKEVGVRAYPIGQDCDAGDPPGQSLTRVLEADAVDRAGYGCRTVVEQQCPYIGGEIENRLLIERHVAVMSRAFDSFDRRLAVVSRYAAHPPVQLFGEVLRLGAEPLMVDTAIQQYRFPEQHAEA